jgi:hypothetical protein
MPDEQGPLNLDEINLADALTPFSRQEQARLVRYGVRAERLASCSFFKRDKPGLTMNMNPTEGFTAEMPHAPDEDDEAIDAMYQRLRNLYSPGRSTAASFKRIVGLLRDHAAAKGSPDANALLSLLDEVEKAEERAATTGPGIGMVRETRDETGNVISHSTHPREVLEDWMYGEHLHDDEDRLARIEPFRDIGAHRFTALSVATDLARVYVSFSRWIVARVLDEASLFPEPLSTDHEAAA